MLTTVFSNPMAQCEPFPSLKKLTDKLGLNGVVKNMLTKTNTAMKQKKDKRRPTMLSFVEEGSHTQDVSMLVQQERVITRDANHSNPGNWTSTAMEVKCAHANRAQCLEYVQALQSQDTKLSASKRDFATIMDNHFPNR